MIRSSIRSQSGLSLIELLIGIALSVLLLSAVVYVFVASRQSYSTQEQLARLQESGRYAMDFLTQDLRRAGYLGGNADVESITGADVAVEPACADDQAWGRRIGQRVFGLNDTAAGYACIPNRLRGDVLVVRYAEAPVVTTAPVAGRLYLRSSLFQGQVMSGNEASSVEDDPQWVRVLAAHAYYIAESERQCEGRAIPALWRVQLDPGNGRPATPVELVPGVEQLQVSWGVDNNGDRAVDEYLPADEVDDWTQVLAARVWVLARSECPEGGFIDTLSYLLGDQPAYVPSDAYRRQLYVSTVQLRNRPSGADGGLAPDDDEDDDDEVEGPGEGGGGGGET